MLERILELWSCFDWLSPIITIIQNIFNGPTHTFHVPLGGGWSAMATERLLREHGVQVWNKMIFNGTIMFTVRDEQARWAEYLLQRHRVPINNPLAADRTHVGAAGRRRAAPPSPLDSMDAALDGLERALTGRR